MNPGLSERAEEYETDSLSPPQPAAVSEDMIRRGYEHFAGILELYHEGRAAIAEVEARKLESNTQTLAKILDRIKREDREAARRRLGRAAVLVSELEEIEKTEGMIVYTCRKEDQK